MAATPFDILRIFYGILLSIFYGLESIVRLVFLTIFKGKIHQSILFRWVYPAGFQKSIEGDIVLITGGGSGIGRLMALKLAKLGAVIVTWDVNTKGNQETVR